MKKIIRTVTATYHSVPNIGAFLQTFALHRIINGMSGIQDEILDFRPYRQDEIHTKEIYGKPRGIRSTIVFFWGKLHQGDVKKRTEQFEQQRQHFLRLSDRCKEWEDVRAVIRENQYDILISGSDQIWNAELADYSPVYFFPGLTHKISYGSSLGFQISERTKKNVRQYAGEYSYIAAREAEAARELTEITGSAVPVVLDPSLLLEKEDYLALMEKEDKISVSGDYILLYSVICDHSVLEKARKLSRQFKLPVIAVYNGGTFRRAIREVRYGFKVDYVSGPGRFLQYLRDARLVVTDSFHGTAMSVLFHKDFLRIQEVHDGKPKKDNRIDTLLSSLDLDDRTVSVLSDRIPEKEINWENVDRRLDRMRAQSLQWLENAIRNTAEEIG